MNGGRALGRALLAGMFIHGGFRAAKEPGGRVATAAKAGIPNPEMMVRLNGSMMALGGVLLALGIKPKFAALILMGCLIPTTYAGHQFWNQETKQASDQQTIQFLKNSAMLGGLVLVMTEDSSAT